MDRGKVPQCPGTGTKFTSCLDVARQRRQLLALDETKLRDVGISRTDALREANRQFWDIPEHLKPRR
jgi:hypothetical protein